MRIKQIMKISHILNPKLLVAATAVLLLSQPQSLFAKSSHSDNGHHYAYGHGSSSVIATPEPQMWATLGSFLVLAMLVKRQVSRSRSPEATPATRKNS